LKNKKFFTHYSLLITHYFRRRRGFTLIEILIAVSIVGIVTVTATGLFTYSLRSNQKTRAILEVKQVGDSAISTMANKIRGAQEIISPACVSTPSEEIYIDIIDADGNGVTFSLEDLDLDRIKMGDRYLTSEDLEVTACAFKCFEGSPEVVEISFTLGKNIDDPLQGFELDFMTSVSLRSY